nr:hypothetical protein [Tanacetum cinerariifolium]
ARVSGLSWGRWGRVVGIVWSGGGVQELEDVVLQVVARKMRTNRVSPYGLERFEMNTKGP